LSVINKAFPSVSESDPTSVSGFLSWLIATVGGVIAIFGGLIAIIQYRLGRGKERRETRQAQAKTGYELVDALFDDITAGPLLDNLDAGLDASPALRRRGHAIEEAKKFKRAFQWPPPKSDPEIQDVLIRFDTVLYYLDRFEHSIVEGLTTFVDVKASFEYYARALAPFSIGIEEYAKEVGYIRAVKFLQRYEVWKGAAKK
jgi:hypothetical protein